MHDGAVLEIAKDVQIDRPIHVMFVTDAAAAKGMMHPRNLIVVGRNAKATVIESYVSLSDAMYLTNAVTEVSVAEGATLTHYKMQREAARAYHVGTIEVCQAKDSHYVSFSLATGAALSRSNVYTTLDGAGCGATLNGLSMLDGALPIRKRRSSTRTELLQPGLYKAVLDDRSHGVFNARCTCIRRVKTDGKQTNKTLLLSDRAMDPSRSWHLCRRCEVHAWRDDRPDRSTALFYLKSRGIGNALARRLLTYAFAAEVRETLEVDAIREGLERMTLERFV